MSCKAQQIFPLNSSALHSPNNSYFKDLNNELDYYVGSWQTSYQDKSIKLVISKETNIPFEMWRKSFSRDLLIVRYQVTINGAVQQSSLNQDFTNDKQFWFKSIHTEDNGDKVLLAFYGGNCGIGMGDIIFRKINATQFYWSYFPKTVRTNEINCPPNQDFTIYLPETENLIFTKQ